MISNYSQTILKKYSTGEQLCDLLWLLPRPTCGPVQPDAQEGKDFTSSSRCYVAISYQHGIMIIYIRLGSTWGSCSTCKCCGLGCGLLVLVNWRFKDSETEKTHEVQGPVYLLTKLRYITTNCSLPGKVAISPTSLGCLPPNLMACYSFHRNWRFSQPLVWTLWAFNCLEKRARCCHISHQLEYSLSILE